MNIERYSDDFLGPISGIADPVDEQYLAAWETEQANAEADAQTSLAIEQLRAKIDVLQQRLDRAGQWGAKVEKRLAKVEKRLTKVGQWHAKTGQRLAKIEGLLAMRGNQLDVVCQRLMEMPSPLS